MRPMGEAKGRGRQR